MSSIRHLNFHNDKNIDGDNDNILVTVDSVLLGELDKNIIYQFRNKITSGK